MALEQVLDRALSPGASHGVIEEQVHEADLLQERVEFEDHLIDVGARREVSLAGSGAEVVTNERKASLDSRLDRVSKRPGLPVELGCRRIEEASSAEGGPG